MPVSLYDNGLTFLKSAVGRLERLYELPSTANRIASLEGMRGLAVALVFWVHYHSLFGPWAGALLEPLSFRLYVTGHAGVDIFFILSGYLISGLVLERRPPLRRFLWRRAVRLWPAFLPVFALYTIASLALPELSKMPPAWPDAVVWLTANALLLPGFFDIKPMITVAWSLSYEVVFYTSLGIGAACVALHRWSSTMRCLALLLFAGFYLWFCYVYGWIFYPRIHLAPGVHPRMVLFIGGMLVREFLARGFKPTSFLAPVVLFITGLAMYSCIVEPPASLGFLPGSPNLRNSIAAGVLFLTLPWLIAAAIAHPSKLLESRPLRWLGNISYSFYLLHGPALQVLAKLLPKPAAPHPVFFLLLIPLAMTFATAVSTVLFAAVEKPFSLNRSRRHGATSSYRP